MLDKLNSKYEIIAYNTRQQPTTQYQTIPDKIVCLALSGFADFTRQARAATLDITRPMNGICRQYPTSFEFVG